MRPSTTGPDLVALLRLALLEYQRFAAMLTDPGPVDFERPTRLAGWTVRDLVAHVAWGQTMEAESLRQALGEAADVPLDQVGPSVEPAVLVAALHRGHAELNRSVESIAEAVADHPDGAGQLGHLRLPTSALSAPAAALLFAVEATTHAADLAEALGIPHILTPDALTACIGFTVPLLGFTGSLGGGANVGTTLALRGRRLNVRAIRHEQHWRFETDSSHQTADATVAGSDEALVLFTLGRLRVDSDQLAVTGNADLASRFKEFFPGP